MSEVEIYKTEDGKTQINVLFEEDTVWLSQNQLVALFEGSRTNIAEHIKNIYKTGELEENSTCRKFRQVQKEGKRTVTRQVEHFNLDVVISVGYRVNSKRGVQFRQWATQRLKDYLIQGVAINQSRLKELQQTINLISNTDILQLPEAKGLLDIINNYTRSFVLLHRFDKNMLSKEALEEAIIYEIDYQEARSAINELQKQLEQKKEATSLFGNEKDDGFKSSLQAVVQTFGGKYLYPSIEEQAAHLLYFIIKNHSFSDGNKRMVPFFLYGF